ncbi:hypothetical protein [Blautia obeum]|uniref:hypothetical protein n=1 Tax=Blautia obeum TaxID=40520 RepID=UPI001FA9556D|nr:hypothetical protein [Blautia obeum]
MKTVRTWCIRILMILFTIIFLYPLFWNLMSAFKTNAEYLTDPYALPVSLNLNKSSCLKKPVFMRVSAISISLLITN